MAHDTVRRQPRTSPRALARASAWPAPGISPGRQKHQTARGRERPGTGTNSCRQGSHRRKRLSSRRGRASADQRNRRTTSTEGSSPASGRDVPSSWDRKKARAAPNKDAGGPAQPATGCGRPEEAAAKNRVPRPHPRTVAHTPRATDRRAARSDATAPRGTRGLAANKGTRPQAACAHADAPAPQEHRSPEGGSTTAAAGASTGPQSGPNGPDTTQAHPRQPHTAQPPPHKAGAAGSSTSSFTST